MKTIKFFGLISLLAAAVAFTGCTEGPKTDPIDPSEGITLTATKTVIYDDGSYKTELTVTSNADNADITSKAHIINVTTNEYLDKGATEFTSETTGVFELRASVTDEEDNQVKSNIITITVNPTFELTSDTYYLMAGVDSEAHLNITLFGENVNSTATVRNNTDDVDLTLSSGNDFSFKMTESKEYKFTATLDGRTSNEVVIAPGSILTRSTIFKYTGIWCQYCYPFANTLHDVKDKYPGRINSLSIYDDIDSPDQNKFTAYQPSASRPTALYDMNGNTQGAAMQMVIENHIKSKFNSYPSATGISVTSTLTGKSAKLDIKVYAEKESNYKLAVVLAEDGYMGRQSTPNGYINDYEHNDIMRRLVSGSVIGDDLGTIAAGQVAEKSYTFEISSDYKIENCKFLIYVTYESGENTFIDNSAYCPAAGSIGYAFGPKNN